MGTSATPPTPPIPPKAVTVPVGPDPKLEEDRRKELKQRHDALRARMATSKLKVIAPTGFTPYWARKDDTAEMARLDYLGFRIVKEPPDGEPRFKAQGRRVDGTYVMGDVILMEIKTEEYEFYISENSSRAAAMSQAAKDKFREDAEKVGAPTFTVKRKA